VNFIVVLEPSRQQSDYGLSIRQDRQPSIIAFEVLTKASAMPLDSGERTGVKQSLRPKAVAASSAIDACDREVMAWLATSAGISGEMVRDLMVACTCPWRCKPSRCRTTIRWDAPPC
jgi:hypothetical protein